MWLIAPRHGGTLRRDGDGEVGVHVAGQAFEATVTLRVRRAGATGAGPTVAEETLTLDAGPPAQGEARVRVALPPGTYVFEAYAASAADGSVQHLDDHTVTVR